MIITVYFTDKGKAIGRGGKNMQKARFLVSKYFDVDKVSIIGISPPDNYGESKIRIWWQIIKKFLAKRIGSLFK